MPYIDENDLLLVAGDLGAGIFPASELYDWHVMAIKNAGRDPVSKVRFGLALKEAGWKSYTKYREGRMARCWMINKPWAARGYQYVTSPTPVQD